jgi:hypothetical protein
VDIVAGTTADLALTLEPVAVASATSAPTQPGAATPVATGTAPSVPPTAGSGKPPVSGGGAGSSAGAAVTSLPNTGSGIDDSENGLLLLLAAIGCITLLGGWGIRRRRS